MAKRVERVLPGDPEKDMRIGRDRGAWVVQRVYGDGRFGFQRVVSVLNPGRPTREEAEADLARLRRIREDAKKHPLSELTT